MYTFYLDLEDPDTPYLVIKGNKACWIHLYELSTNLVDVWLEDRVNVDDVTIQPEYILLGVYDDLNGLKMVHLLEN